MQELRVDEIIAKLADYRSPMEAERCSDTLKNVIANALDTETNKIVELIEVVARKMSPPMRRFLTEGAELLHQDSNSMDRIMMYLEDSLQTLNAELNEVNFERILDAIWTELAFILKELVQNNIDVSKQPSTAPSNHPCRTCNFHNLYFRNADHRLFSLICEILFS